jgi:hypothetical protein
MASCCLTPHFLQIEQYKKFRQSSYGLLINPLVAHDYLVIGFTVFSPPGGDLAPLNIYIYRYK